MLLQSEADRTLIYLTLYITECLKKLQKVGYSCIIVSYIAIFVLKRDVKLQLTN